MRAIRKGSQGQDVRQVQTFLASRRVYSGEVDGSYGSATEDAVKDYQKLHNLIPDGVVGAGTWSSLLKEGIDMILDTDQEWPPPPDYLKPLVSNEDRMRRWGRYDYRPAPEKDNKEAIIILGDWEDKNIVTIDCPVFKKHVRIHRQVADNYTKLMQDIILADLQHLLITHDGAFVPRFIRGSTQRLSNHSWGTAFDVNYEWNQLGCTPTYKGQKGSVRELVPLANKHNFYWGGHFKFRRDGMHFEACP